MIILSNYINELPVISLNLLSEFSSDYVLRYNVFSTYLDIPDWKEFYVCVRVCVF